MSPTLEELELGEKAYNRVRFYENVTLKDIPKIPWIFAVCAGLVFLGCIPPETSAKRGVCQGREQRHEVLGNFCCDQPPARSIGAMKRESP